MAALVVVIHHAVTYLGPAARPDSPEWLYAYARIGAAGVRVFFVISGVVMVVTSWTAFGTPESPGQFLARRALRIHPIYRASAALYLALGPLVGEGVPDSAAKVLAALLLLPGSAAAIIPPGWGR